MNQLLNHIKHRIDAEGPLSVADYMMEALTHPEYGYYIKGDPLGKRGDFITAPETSQMFGELIGLWCASVWEQMGSPSNINLVEIGPGRGTLMSDSLRALSIAPDFLKAITIFMIETSPILRKRQKRNLKAINHDIKWCCNFKDIPGGPFILIANEVIDVLPIRQFEKSDLGWFERKVGCDENGNLTWEIDKDQIIGANLIPPNIFDSKEGSIFEFGEEGTNLVRDISASVTKFGGAALIVDYGYLKTTVGDTLQGMRKHKYHNVLSDPGYVDLTSHVNFEHIAHSARVAGGQVYGAISQRDYLLQLGILIRANLLKKTASVRQRSDVLAGLKRLIDVDEMGGLFKVLAITGPSQPVPEGFMKFVN